MPDRSSSRRQPLPPPADETQPQPAAESLQQPASDDSIPSTVDLQSHLRGPSGDSSSSRSSSSRAPLHVGGQAPLDTQPTIITKSPLAQYPLSGLHPRDMGRLLEGESLGHFELLEYIGGGMGAVFKALDTMLNRSVAVKVLSQEQSGDEEMLRRFQNEAQAAARLDHENISRVHYVGEDRGWHYIVFEFIEGANVRDQVHEQGPLPLAEAVSYTLQIADALAHASSRDVVHRDIKPSNVLITPDGRAKLVDMGLARQHHVEADGNDLTASGVTLGTFDYISPEQARDPRSADVRSDIYSLGCTLYFMLTGRPPFPEGTVLQKLLQHQGDEPPDPRQFRPDLPDDLLKIMHRMLAKSPDKRFATPGELVADLAAFAQRHGFPTTPTSSVVWLPPEQTPLTLWERHLPWAAPLAVLVIIVAALNLIWSHEAGHAAPPPLRTATVPINQSPAAEPSKQPEPTKQLELKQSEPMKQPEQEVVTPAAPVNVSVPMNTAVPVNSASPMSPSSPPAEGTPASASTPTIPLAPGSTGG
jgi:serine/threonine protein kinase